jgi:hypothetical protein
MAELFTSGRIVDLIFVLVAIEFVVLAVLWARSGRGVAPLSIVANLASGACLLLALRASLTQASWQMVAAFLAAAFMAHLADLMQRWR